MNLDFKTLKDLKNKGTGFISPDAKVYPISLYQHSEFLREFNEFKNEFEEFDEYIGDEKDRFIDGLDPNDHPEWHLFEIWEDDENEKFRQKLYKKVYKIGWSRIGLYYLRSKNLTLEVEHSKDFNKEQKKVIKEISNFLNAEISYNQIKLDN